MNVTLFTKMRGRSAVLRLDQRRCWLPLTFSFLVLCALLLQAGYRLGKPADNDAADDRGNRLAQTQIDTLAQRLGRLQAQMQRLDALGRRLSQVAGLDPDEFNLDAAPAVGGPQAQGASAEPSLGLVQQALQRLTQFVGLREQRLNVLDRLLASRGFTQPRFLFGEPAAQTWVSSAFGMRNDPFTGHLDFHSGIDFAGYSGEPVQAAADGVVSWVGTREGYGRMVEIDHGNGLVTHYAHNRRNLVKVGEVVSKGQTIALMGSSGRSTGPHVHFEVLREGITVDPALYFATLPQKPSL